VACSAPTAVGICGGAGGWVGPWAHSRPTPLPWVRLDAALRLGRPSPIERRGCSGCGALGCCSMGWLHPHAWGAGRLAFLWGRQKNKSHKATKLDPGTTDTWMTWTWGMSGLGKCRLSCACLLLQRHLGLAADLPNSPILPSSNHVIKNEAQNLFKTWLQAIKPEVVSRQSKRAGFRV